MRTAFQSEGDLQGVDILAALVTLWRESSTGTLRAERPGSAAGFVIGGGEVLGVFSSDPRFETSAILVRAGKVDAAALDRLVAPEGSDRALAALAAGILTKREWRWGEKIRAIEVLSDLLTWTEGSYVFDFSARAEGGDLRLPIPRLLLELFLRSRDRHLIEHQLGPVDAPLVRSENFEQEFAGFGLTVDAESVVRLIDGRATAAEIAEKAPADEFAVQKLLASLVTLGLVRPEFVAEEPVPPSAPAEPAEEPEAFESRVEEKIFGTADQTAIAPTPGPEIPESGAVPEPAFPDSYEEPPPPEPPPSFDSEEPEEIPAAVEEEAALPEWEDRPAEPLDRTLQTPIEPVEPPRARGRGASLAWLLGLLAAGVVAFFLWPRQSQKPAAGEPAPVAGAGAISPAPERGAPAAPESSPMTPEAATAPARVPGQSSQPAADEARERWLGRAERDRRRLESEPRTRYTVQLELACEVSTLETAWKHDRPSGTMWLLTSPHAGKTCFKVLWGRYPSLDAARDAKSAVPPFFSTGGNRPTVVGVRQSLLP